MKQVYKYDENGAYAEPVMIYPNENGEYILPGNCTDKELPQPNWKPIFQNGDWVETISEEELATLQNQPVPKTEIEIMKDQQDLMQKALDDLILGGMM